MRRVLSTVIALILALPVLGWAQTTMVIINANGPGEGFNDPRPVAPTGINTGTTLGAQRFQAFEHAARIWEDILDSQVPIIIEATFEPLPCAESSATLGFAGPLDVFADFVNAPRSNTWFPGALADKLARVDQAPGEADIVVTINSALDEVNGCLGDTTWYYGLDGAPPEDTIDVVETILHEIAHGLGFVNIVDEVTFAFPFGMPDIYSVFTLDLERVQFWSSMTSPQRAISAVNDPHLVWGGHAVTTALPEVLAPAVTVTAHSPAAATGNYDAQAALFGPPVPPEGISGRLVLVNDQSAMPTLACGPIQPLAPGAIALIDRGECFFTEKVLHAQAAGAIAVIIANNESDGLPPLGGDDPGIVIPTVGVSQQTGERFKSILPQDIEVTIGLDETNFAGTKGGFLRLHAPNPFQPGSSISHWTPFARPNLLMQPAAGVISPYEVDLTLPQLQDIGWTNRPQFLTEPVTTATPGVRYEYEIQVEDIDVGDIPSVEALSLPLWLNLGPTTNGAALLSGTPNPSDAGNHPVSLRVIDQHGEFSIQNFTISVDLPDGAIHFTTAPPPRAAVGALYRYDLSVNPAGAEDSITLTAPVLPAWLQLSPLQDGAAILMGTPQAEHLGPHLVVLRVEDGNAASAEQSFTVTVADLVPPVITLNGPASLTLECGEAFTDPGATAIDNVDGPISVATACNLNTQEPGQYVCTYSAADAAGNTAAVSRFITVVDTQPPVITLNGPPEITIVAGQETYNEPGATVTDSCDGNLNVVIGGDPVNDRRPGVYLVTYNATDASGNAAEQVIRRVEVLRGGLACSAGNGPSPVAGAADMVMALALCAGLLARGRAPSRRRQTVADHSRKKPSTRSR